MISPYPWTPPAAAPDTRPRIPACYDAHLGRICRGIRIGSSRGHLLGQAGALIQQGLGGIENGSGDRSASENVADVRQLDTRPVGHIPLANPGSPELALQPCYSSLWLCFVLLHESEGITYQPMAVKGKLMADTPATIEARVSERIRGLYLRETEGLSPQPSQRSWALAKGLDPQKYNDWFKNGTQPGYENLLLLEEKFKIPWQWFLVGDEGADVIRRTSKARKRQDEEIRRRRTDAIGTAHLQALRPMSKKAAG